MISQKIRPLSYGSSHVLIVSIARGTCSVLISSLRIMVSLCTFHSSPNDLLVVHLQAMHVPIWCASRQHVVVEAVSNHLVYTMHIIAHLHWRPYTHAALCHVLSTDPSCHNFLPKCYSHTHFEICISYQWKILYLSFHNILHAWSVAGIMSASIMCHHTCIGTE